MTNADTDFKPKFGLHTYVHIDGDKSIRGFVSGVFFKELGSSCREYEVQWMHNGDNKVAWIKEERLSACDD